ncbi:MAG TPA: hypothetical protein PKL15_10440 [Saprospiraceae bacterium]|nr:hypothetical protein [Saprospiraceae bacterium]
MKPICLFFFYALFLVRIEAQTPGAAVRPCLDSVLNFAQQHALKRNEVNWDSVRSLVYAKAAGAQNTSELGPAFSALLGALGDDHGRVLPATGRPGHLLAIWPPPRPARRLDSRCAHRPTSCSQGRCLPV